MDEDEQNVPADQSEMLAELKEPQNEDISPSPASPKVAEAPPEPVKEDPSPKIEEPVLLKDELAVDKSMKKDGNKIENSKRIDDKSALNKTSSSKISDHPLFKISPEIVELSETPVIMYYIFEKVWKRFEAKNYIDTVVIPKQPQFVADEMLKFTPYIIENFTFDHDEGEVF